MDRAAKNPSFGLPGVRHMTKSLGLESGIVRLVPYDPAWPELFVAEAARIRGALAMAMPIALEHVGSTAVPGLAAKPVLDILGGYPLASDVRQYVEALCAAGYVHRGEQGIPGREFFRRGDPRCYHLHLARAGGAFWCEHLAFRDYLRAHAGVRDDYAELKRELAERFPRDREAYMAGKAPFIKR